MESEKHGAGTEKMPPDYRKEQDAAEKTRQHSLGDLSRNLKQSVEDEAPRDRTGGTIDRTGTGQFPDAREPNSQDRSSEGERS